MYITPTVEICIQQLGRVEELVFTARCSYASAVLGVVILSVCPSVTRGLVTKHACIYHCYPRVVSSRVNFL